MNIIIFNVKVRRLDLSKTHPYPCTDLLIYFECSACAFSAWLDSVRRAMLEQLEAAQEEPWSGPK